MATLQKFFAARYADDRRADAAASGRGTYTQN